ncbi:MAG TPA: hypothetical protein VML55_08025 [Planctomycetaceae bacterium]|nr:hypothetical protein [Planctomycetaceae bacterium]
MNRDVTNFFDSLLNAAILWAFIFVYAMRMPRVHEAFGILLAAVESIGGTPVRY